MRMQVFFRILFQTQALKDKTDKLIKIGDIFFLSNKNVLYRTGIYLYDLNAVLTVANRAFQQSRKSVQLTDIPDPDLLPVFTCTTSMQDLR
jgi:hypothetical protein